MQADNGDNLSTMTAGPNRKERFMGELINRDNWKFVHNEAENADWTPGLRDIFEYRDLGTKEGTGGDDEGPGAAVAHPRV
jgi:hypothetical protein